MQFPINGTALCLPVFQTHYAIDQGEKMKKESIAVSILMFISIATAIGMKCIEFHEKKEKQKLHDSAAVAAQEYLQSKYGFTSAMSDETGFPERQKVLLRDNIYEFSSEYGGKDFYVWVNKNDDSSIRCKDSYQHDEICSDIEKELKKEFPVSFISYFWIGDNDEWQTDISLHGGFSDYYTGDNLDELMKNGRASLTMCIADASIENTNVTQKLSDLNFRYCLTVFDTAEHLDEFEKFSGKSIFASSYMDYQYAAPYFTEHRDNSGDEEHRLSIDI